MKLPIQNFVLEVKFYRLMTGVPFITLSHIITFWFFWEIEEQNVMNT